VSLQFAYTIILNICAQIVRREWGPTENAGVENAGVEISARKWRRMQWWKMRESRLWNANPILRAVVQHGVNRVFLLMLLLLWRTLLL